MKLKRGPRFGLTYHTQLKIYAVCLNYRNEPPEVQQKIIRLCQECGGEYHKALFEAVTTEKRYSEIVSNFYLSEPTLNRIVTKFFQKWAENGKDESR